MNGDTGDTASKGGANKTGLSAQILPYKGLSVADTKRRTLPASCATKAGIMNCTEAVILAEPIGTHVDLSADSPTWHAEAFMEGIIMCFRHRPRVRIQALYFNGLQQFDYRQNEERKENNVRTNNRGTERI